MTADERAARVVARVARLAALSATPRGVTRLAFGAEDRAAVDLVAGWAVEAGARIERDAAGTLFALRPGADRTLPSLALGSHLDTVSEGGAWDGTLGVLVALEVLDALAAPPRDVLVLAFADEEGARFGTGCFGSRAMAGELAPGELDLVDARGVTLRAALADFGGRPVALAGARRPPGAFLEVHLEQGPALEADGVPLGVARAIAGNTRVAVRFTGHAGHAGTVPMGLRHDAVAAAAAWAVAVEALAEPPVVATVGRFAARPGEVNVIAGEVEASLDVRGPDDRERHDLVERLRERAAAEAARRGCAVAWSVALDRPAVDLAGPVTDALRAAAGQGAPSLVCGAGHDSAIIAGVAPAGLLLVRCRGGVSHHPDEHVEEADVATAVDVALRAAEELVRGWT